MHRWSAWSAAVLLASAILCTLAATPAAAAEDQVSLAAVTSFGQDALQALTASSTQFAAVAAKNQMTIKQVAELLAANTDAGVTPSGSILFACDLNDPSQNMSFTAPGLPGVGGGGLFDGMLSAYANAAVPTSDVDPTDLSQTFTLHSRPGATKKIYLNFQGCT